MEGRWRVGNVAPLAKDKEPGLYDFPVPIVELFIKKVLRLVYQ